MKIERFEDLIDWTRDTHAMLARCMARCSDKHDETRAKWLLVYIADHERALAETVEKIERHADPKALHTWIYDYLTRNPVLRNQACKAYDTMSVEEISLDIFTIHNQVIDLYRSLARRAEIDGARNLAEDLLHLEEHETMRLARQVSRIHEISADAFRAYCRTTQRLLHGTVDVRAFRLSRPVPGSLRRCDPAAHAV